MINSWAVAAAGLVGFYKLCVFTFGYFGSVNSLSFNVKFNVLRLSTISVFLRLNLGNSLLASC